MENYRLPDTILSLLNPSNRETQMWHVISLPFSGSVCTHTGTHVHAHSPQKTMDTVMNKIANMSVCSNTRNPAFQEGME